MAGQPYQRATERFRCHGIDLNNPVDNVRPGYYPLIENIRSYTDGVIQPRQGLTAINTVVTNSTPVHTVRRLNDPNSGNFQRIVGAGTALAYGTAAFTQAQYNASNVVFSGNPVTMVPFRPDQAISSWMYIADSIAMYKIVGNNPQSITAGTVHKIGVVPPTVAPTAELSNIAFSGEVNLLLGGTGVNALLTDGTVFTGAVATTSRIPTGLLTTTGLVDSSTLWTSLVVPSGVADVAGVGQQIGLTNGAQVEALVVEIHRASNATTISSILYDNAPTNTGVCIIQPAVSLAELARNSVVHLDSGGAADTYARVTDLIYGSDGTISFKCSTGANTLTSTKTLQLVDTIRVNGNKPAATNIQDFVSGAINPGSNAFSANSVIGAALTTGWIQTVPSTAYDLTGVTKDANFANAPGYTDDSIMSLGFQFSDTSKLVQGRLLFDCDNTSLAIGSTSIATPTVVSTVLAHQLASGDCVYISGAADAACNGTFYITVLTTGTFSLFTNQARTTAVVGAGGGAAGTVKPLFKKNFYYRAFTPNDLITAVKATQTALANSQTTINNNFVAHPGIAAHPRDRNIPERGAGAGGRGEGSDPRDPGGLTGRAGDPNAPAAPGSVRTQTGTGDYTWSQLQFRRGELVPVGPIAVAKGNLGAIRAFRVELSLTDTTAATTIVINSLSMWGVSPPEVTDLASPYQYRYRYRVSNTGAVSNWSPATRSGIISLRNTISVTCSTSTAAEVDKIDIQRLGGVNTTWLVVGTTANSSTAFSDNTSDLAAAAAAPVSDLDTNFQPWPVLGKPVVGTLSTNGVVGAYITSTSSGFSISWAKGTPIKVDGVDTQIRRVLSASILEIDDSLGTRASKTFEIPQPTLIGQPLPALWEWNSQGFACGDLNNPGYLYYSNGGSLDTTQDINFVEITPPSEPLIMGCSFNGKNYVWSSERMFEIWQLGPNNFQGIEIPGHKGLFSRYALCVGEKIWYMSRDGIYQTGGGDSICITDQTLKPLFTLEGNAGTAVNGFNPPDFTQPLKMRLSYYKGYLYFTFIDSGAAYRTLVYTVHSETPGWWPDKYLDGAGITTFYGEEGDGVNSLLACGNDTTTGKLYTMSGTADGAAPIAAKLRTQYFDANERRADKRWGDLIVDADSQGATITASMLINGSTGSSLTLSPVILSTSTSGRTQTIIDCSAGADPASDFSKNAALDLTWTSTGLTPKVYFWEPAYTIRPEQTELRATTWDDLGIPADKYIQGVEIDANTFGVTKTINVEYDGSSSNIIDTLSVNHTGRQIKSYAFRPPGIAHIVRLHPTDTNPWSIYGSKFYFQPEAALGERWQTQQIDLSNGQFGHMKELWVTVMSTQAVSLTINRIDDNSTTVYTIPSSSGLRLKQRIILQASASKMKSGIFTFSSTAAGGQFRLYKDETYVLAKPWQSEDAYRPVQIFGGPSGGGKAQI